MISSFGWAGAKMDVTDKQRHRRDLDSLRDSPTYIP